MAARDPVAWPRSGHAEAAPRTGRGFFCLNDFVSDWGAPLTIAYDVITDRETRFNLTTDFTSPSGGGFYSDGTNVFIHVHQNDTMNASDTYQLHFHL
jgi:hypothetical protein